MHGQEHLLVQPRHADEHRRLGQHQHLGHLAGVRDVGVQAPGHQHLERPRALEGVREGQEGERGVLGRDREELVEGIQFEGEAAVGEDGAAGLPGRAGGVDEGRHVVRGRRREPGVDLGVRLGAGGAGEDVAQRLDAVGARGVDRPHGAQVGQFRPDGLDAGQQVGVLDDREGGSGVGDHVAHLVGRAGRVERDRHRADGEQREVDHRPLGPVGAEQCDAITGRHPALDEVAGEPADRPAEFGVREFLPVGAPEDAGRGPRGVASEHVLHADGDVVGVHGVRPCHRRAPPTCHTVPFRGRGMPKRASSTGDHRIATPRPRARARGRGVTIGWSLCSGPPDTTGHNRTTPTLWTTRTCGLGACSLRAGSRP